MTQLKADRPDIHQILSQLPLFAELMPEQIANVAAGTREKRIGRGEILFHKGDTPRGFFVIVFGQVKLAFPSSQGNDKVVEILGPKQSFGEAVMFMNRPYPVFAETLGDTLLLHIAKNTVFELLERDNSFARRMLAGLSVRLHTLLQDVESYSLSSSTQRLIGFLLQHCDIDEAGTDAMAIVLPTSKQVIASRLNLTPETLSRIFNQLGTAGLITVEGRKVTIHDPQRLREFDF